MAKKTQTPPKVEKNQAPAAPVAATPRETGEYTVVARRYRPRQFLELIGQEHVARSLVNALQSDRVAHAYLFTGARGVGKTSAARILAKALNCVKGPTPTPCDECENCKGIAAGDDVDVLEIDGASNNKVEEIRDLRQNVAFRPTRSRYKIYIIDEVHMLTTSAFNALLKTLEEPPPHVKFIFATTEVQKIPITILSRCQRFDFAHVGPAKIFEQLKRIVEHEGLEADEEALGLIARRAGGSMRDSQSVLDQLLASITGRLTLESVHAVLGTPGDERVTQLAEAVLNHDATAALNLIAAWIDQGLQPVELMEQLIGYWRALMLVSCGGPEVRDLPLTPTQHQAVLTQVKRIGLDAILAGLEVWTATRSRMRDATHAQVLLEMAVVRLARLDDLVPISQLVQALNQLGTGAVSVAAPPPRQSLAAPEASEHSKKNSMENGPTSLESDLAGQELSTVSLSEATVLEVWERMIRYLAKKSPILANHLKSAGQAAIFGPNALVIRFSAEYTHTYEACATEASTQRLQEALQKITGQPALVRVERVTGALPGLPSPTAKAQPGNPVQERRKQLMSLPLFKKASETLGAQIWHVDEDFNPSAPPRPASTTPEDPDEM
jgi:DNA polymerase-3 subunit gamma/tau